MARIGSSRVDASLGALRCLLSVAVSARWRFSHHIITGDGSHSLPHPLIRFIKTSSTHQLSDPSRLQREAPSTPLNGQIQSPSPSLPPPPLLTPLPACRPRTPPPRWARSSRSWRPRPPAPLSAPSCSRPLISQPSTGEARYSPPLPRSPLTHFLLLPASPRSSRRPASPRATPPPPTSTPSSSSSTSSPPAATPTTSPGRALTRPARA